MAYCVKDALIRYIANTVPNVVMSEDMPALCDRFGFEWLTDGNFELEDGVPYIVVFKTGDGTGHAEYTRTIGHYLDEHIIGVAVLENIGG